MTPEWRSVPVQSSDESKGYGALNDAADQVGFWEWSFLVVALLGQQDAFLNVARVLQGKDAADQSGSASDPLNMLVVALTAGGLALLLSRRLDLLAGVLRHSFLILTLSGFALLSALWSDAVLLTIKRALVHLNTIALALYLAARLPFRDLLRCVAVAAAIGAAASLVVGVAYPAAGQMHIQGLEGRWRGVYSHKNTLAQAMAVGVFSEAYLVSLKGRRLVHIGIALLEVGLIVLSNSVTVLSIVILGLSSYAGFSLFARGGSVRRVLLLTGPALVGGALAAVMLQPTLLQKLSGRDASLSGRTELWSGVEHAISLKPLLGYGYQAFWDGGGDLTNQIWREIGWNAPNAHNGVLEVTLELGYIGLALTALVIGQAFWRAAKLFSIPDARDAAVVSMIFLVGIGFESLTEAVFLRQGDIDWLVLNMISFACLWLTIDKAPVSPVPRDILSRARPLPA